MTIEALCGEIEAALPALATEEPSCCRQLRLGRLSDRAGTGGQYFSSWDLAAGMVRDYANYTLYPLVALNREGTLAGASFAASFRHLAIPPTSLLGYLGFEELERWARQAADALPGAGATEVDRLMVALTRYANGLSAWLHHYFPWHLGDAFRYSDQPVREAPRTVAPQADFSHGLPIRLTWQPIGVSVQARLNVAGNPQLCEELLSAMPFTVLQVHSVVAGDSIFAWTPLVSTAPTPHKELICDAPAGRLRFSQRTGQKIVVQYGAVTERILSPVLGQVVPDDIAKLETVGLAVRSGTFKTKNKVFLTAAREA